MTANLTADTATGEGSDTFVAVENLNGTNFADRLTGSNVVNVLNGRAGKDRIVARGQNDIIGGGEDNDTMLGLSGNDTIDGGPDDDWVSFQNSAAGVVVDLAAGTAVGEGNDTLLAVENAIGSDFPDDLRGTGVRNIFRGGLASDTLVGRVGNDRLFGEAAGDTLFGNEDNDLLNGGTQVDTSSEAEA